MEANTIRAECRKTANRRWQAVKDFFYGLTGYEFVHHAREMRHEAESIFLVVTLGDLVGIPVMPPVYALRLLKTDAAPRGYPRTTRARRAHQDAAVAAVGFCGKSIDQNTLV